MVVLPTSGRSGEPKGVLLSRDALIGSATATNDRLGGPGQRLLAAISNMPKYIHLGLRYFEHWVDAPPLPGRVSSVRTQLFQAGHELLRAPSRSIRFVLDRGRRRVRIG